MRGFYSRRIAGLILALGAAVAGCGEDPNLESGVFPFKSTDTSSLAPLRDDMIRTARDRSYLKKNREEGKPDAEPKPTDERKPAGPGSPSSRVDRGG